MTTKNDVTGDDIKSKAVTNSYREQFDKIFGVKLPKLIEKDDRGFEKYPEIPKGKNDY